MKRNLGGWYGYSSVKVMSALLRQVSDRRSRVGFWGWHWGVCCGSYLEIATVEDAVRVDDHKSHLPTEEVVRLCLRLSRRSRLRRRPEAGAYLDINPFLLL